MEASQAVEFKADQFSVKDPPSSIVSVELVRVTIGELDKASSLGPVLPPPQPIVQNRIDTELRQEKLLNSERLIMSSKDWILQLYKALSRIPKPIL